MLIGCNYSENYHVCIRMHVIHLNCTCMHVIHLIPVDLRSFLAEECLWLTCLIKCFLCSFAAKSGTHLKFEEKCMGERQANW